MIRVLALILILSFGLVVPAQAGVWLFGTNKEKPQDSGSSGLYVPPKEIRKKSIMDNIFGVKPEQEDLKAPAIPVNSAFNGITKEMLTTSYTPKSREELLKLASVQRYQQAQGLKEIKAKRDARVSKLKAEQLKIRAAMKKQGDDEMVAVKIAQAKEEKKPVTAGSVPPTSTTNTPPAKAVYNKPAVTKPTKVFTDYR